MKPTLSAGAALAVMAFLAAGCVPPGPDVRRDLNDLKQNSYQSSKDISDNKKALAALKAKLDDLGRNIPREDSMSAIRKSQTTLLGRVNDLHREVQGLMGGVEREQNETRKLSRKTAADLDVLKASSTAIEDLSKRLDSIELEIAIIKKKLEIRGDSAAIPSSTGETGGSPTVSGSAEDEYKTAYDLYQKKKYAKAREAFGSFIKNNKGHKWAGNSQFWIGETHYAQNSYDSAILAYQDVMEKYPKSNKVPDAMLKQGYAFIKKKDSLAAKGVLGELVRKFPDSQAAKNARKKLKSLD